MNQADIRTLVAGLAPVIEEYVESVAGPLRERIATLERQLEDVKAAKSAAIADAYRGAWMAGAEFQRGDLITEAGSLWLALVATKEKPGASSDWRLIVKKGRDGKDLR